MKLPPYNLRLYPDEILTKRMPKHISFGIAAMELSRVLIAAMQRENGLGLAAPQVGIETRAFAFVHQNDRGETKVDTLFNPEIMPAANSKLVAMVEGCLSIPGVYFEVERPSAVVVRGMDHQGKPFVFDASGMLALDESEP